MISARSLNEAIEKLKQQRGIAHVRSMPLQPHLGYAWDDEGKLYEWGWNDRELCCFHLDPKVVPEVWLRYFNQLVESYLSQLHSAVA